MLTVSQKAAISLLITVVVVAVFSVLAFTGFFNLIESRFYNPSITRAQEKEVARDAEAISAFLARLETSFADALEDQAVKRSFLPNQSAQDIFERTRLYGLLLESQKGLQSVRFIDSGGLRLHFSTNAADILNQSEGRVAYRNYTETTPFIPYDRVSVGDQGQEKLVFDQENDRILFAFPFYDSMDVYRGTALYSLSIRAVADDLIKEGRLKVGEDLSLLAVPAGLVSGTPAASKTVIMPIISSVWQEGLLGLTALDSDNSSSSLALVSAKTEDSRLFVGRVVDESVFGFPMAMKIILIIALFLTIYLTIFLCFNLRADTTTVIQNRLKGLEISLIREYYEKKGDMDWNHWYRELESRREEVRAELKRGIKTKGDPALMEDIDSLINKSWDEILTAIGGRRETRLAIDEDKLQTILNRVLAVAPSIKAAAAEQAAPAAQAQTAVSAPAAQAPSAQAAAARAEPAEEVEDLGAAEPAEEVEELGVAEPADELEELGEEGADEVEEIAEAEPAEAEPAAEAEPVEELVEVEPVDDLEELGAEEEIAEALPVEDSPSIDKVAGLEPAIVVPVDEAGSAAQPLPASPADITGAQPKKSNVQLVFGDDDIPTIVESSGLELVDEDVDALMGVQEDEVGELEELEEAELEELGEVPATDVSEAPAAAPPPSHGPQGPAGPTVEDIASQIEFGESHVSEPGLKEDLEIVSPFADMLSRFGEEDEKAPPPEEDFQPIKTSGRLEELKEEGLPVLYKPFQTEEVASPEVIDASGPAGVIEEKDGISYVNADVKSPDEATEKTLDPGLKNLISQVTKK